MQLKDDLKVCKKHLENVCRVNRQVENELVQIEEGSLMAIKKMQAPISNRASQGAKWTCASWRTGADTAEAELFKERNY